MSDIDPHAELLAELRYSAEETRINTVHHYRGLCALAADEIEHLMALVEAYKRMRVSVIDAEVTEHESTTHRVIVR